MKKTIMLLATACYCCLLHAQLNGNLFGTSYSFSKPTMSGGGGGGGGNNNNGTWRSTSTSTTTITSSMVLGSAYDRKASEKYNKGVDAWNKHDWDKAIRFFNEAIAFHDTQEYRDALHDARGYKDWYNGIDEAKKENWKAAIGQYKKALNYFADNTTLKDNIIGCSYNDVLNMAEKNYNSGNWIDAAVYYNILWKNFDNNSAFVQSRYTEAYNKINNMKRAEKALTKYNARLDEAKKELPFVTNGW